MGRVIATALEVLGLILMVVDVGTDIASAYRLCDAKDACGCRPVSTITVTDTEQLSCYQYCGPSISNSSTFWTSTCGYKDPDDCLRTEPWYGNTHPAWCALSVVHILMPSFICNALLLHIIRKMVEYKEFKNTLYALCGLQLLPFAWQVDTIQQLWTGDSNSLDHYVQREEISQLLSVVEVVLEATPQLTIQAYVLMRANVDEAFIRGIEGAVSPLAYIGVVSSCFSISRTINSFILQGSPIPSIIKNVAIFLATGVRVLVAVSFGGGLYPYLALAPLLSAFIVTSILHLLYVTNPSDCHSLGQESPASQYTQEDDYPGKVMPQDTQLIGQEPPASQYTQEDDYPGKVMPQDTQLIGNQSKSSKQPLSPHSDQSKHMKEGMTLASSVSSVNGWVGVTESEVETVESWDVNEYISKLPRLISLLGCWLVSSIYDGCTFTGLVSSLVYCFWAALKVANSMGYVWIEFINDEEASNYFYIYCGIFVASCLMVVVNLILAVTHTILKCIKL